MTENKNISIRLFDIERKIITLALKFFPKMDRSDIIRKGLRKYWIPIINKKIKELKESIKRKESD